MRITFLHNTYQQAGGEDAVASREAALLRENGHEVRLLRVKTPRSVLDLSLRALAIYILINGLEKETAAAYLNRYLNACSKGVFCGNF